MKSSRVSKGLFAVCGVAVVSAAFIGCGEPRNGEPEAVVAADTAQVEVGNEVFVDGSDSSDPDGDPLIFDWSLETPADSAVALGDTRAEAVSFTPDVAGTYTVRLRVDDGEFESSPASATIMATGQANQAPVADAGDDQSVDVGTEITLDGTASSDPDGDDLTFAWSLTQQPPTSTAELSDTTAQKPTLTPDVAGDYVVDLVVDDGSAQSEADTVVVTANEIVPQNEPPVADASASPSTVGVGQTVDLDGSASTDPDGDDAKLTYFWSVKSQPPGSNITSIQGGATANATFRPTHEGTYEIQLEVGDEDGESATDTVSIIAEQTTSDVCLIIGEYIEDGWTKGLELYNCSGQELDLSNFGICMVRGDSGPDACSEDIDLTGTLADGAVITVCNSRSDNNLVGQSLCDLSSGKVSFTGDDPLFIYEEGTGDPGFDASDLITDAFGDIENPPSSEIWSDMVLRRCDFTPADGRSSFDFNDYYEPAGSKTDYSDFGTPPTEGCSAQ